MQERKGGRIELWRRCSGVEDELLVYFVDSFILDHNYINDYMILINVLLEITGSLTNYRGWLIAGLIVFCCLLVVYVFTSSKERWRKRRMSNSRVAREENVPTEIFVEAIETCARDWREKYNVLDISLGKKETNGVEAQRTAIVFKPIEKLFSDDTVFEPIPKEIAFIASDGKTYLLPTDVQQTGGIIEAAFEVDLTEKCDAIFPKRPGCSVSRLTDDDTGTIGLKVYKNHASYLLSCYHVICAPEMKQGVFKIEEGDVLEKDATVISPGVKDQGTAADKLAIITEGRLDEYMDCALAKLNDSLDMKTQICKIGVGPVGMLAIGTEHIQPRLKVFMTGRTSGFKNAYVKSPYANTTIQYGTGKKTLSGLIATTPLAQKGDSGAVVFDEDCNVVGIVVARSPSDTYVIPIARILTAFQIQLKP